MTTKILKSAGLLTAPLILMCGMIAQAGEWDKQTRVSVNEPIQVNGTVLPAGTYVFRLLDNDANRNIVQVLDQNMDRVLATVQAVPNARLEPADKTILTFDEARKGEPLPVHSWFFPGDITGQEFIFQR
jgi:hypothetical protein